MLVSAYSLVVSFRAAGDRLREAFFMNIYDIAKLAGVSIATVSRVVNGSNKVSEKTRTRVLSIIEQEGYTPNVFAQGLGLHTMHTVGILVPDISDLYMSCAVSYLEEQLQIYGYDCILSCSGFDPAKKAAHTQMLLSKHIDALILVGSTYSGHGKDPCETDYIRNAALQVPVFLINGSVAGDNIYCSVSEDRQAVFDATTRLIENGRRRILFLTDSRSYSAAEKKAGFLSALEKAGLPADPALQLMAPDEISGVRDLLLEKKLSFDAAIATDDVMAVGVLKYAAAKGISVPKELAVIGCNNSVLSVSCEPELSSIDNRAGSLCQDTIDHLIAVLGGSTDIPQICHASCRLVCRQTTDF